MRTDRQMEGWNGFNGSSAMWQEIFLTECYAIRSDKRFNYTAMKLALALTFHR
jgi:hypothetical protein